MAKGKFVGVLILTVGEVFKGIQNFTYKCINRIKLLILQPMKETIDTFDPIINLEGKIQELDDFKSERLTPVFEAIVNSIEAIDEKKNTNKKSTDKGEIKIKIIRDLTIDAQIEGFGENKTHKKSKEWTFSKMGKNCVNCHKNEHKGLIEDKFYPEENCTICHNVTKWKTVTFDHNRTAYKLEEAHAKVACSACHYRKNENGIETQLFKSTSKECSTCHKDTHANQFAIAGKTDCSKCHGMDDWHKSRFNHNSSRFKLDGEHVKVNCVECHKPVSDKNGKYIDFKFENIECSSCHS